jgi:tetratricopeptide (TPR) repeat protein
MKKIKFIFLVLILFFSLPSATFSTDNEDERFLIAGKAFSDGFYDASLSLFTKFIEEFPGGKNFYKAKLYIAKCYYFKADYTSALATLNEFAEKKEAQDLADEIYYWLSEIYFKGKNYNSVLSCAAKIISQYPSSQFIWRAYYLSGMSYHELGQADKCDDFFEEIIAKCKDSELVQDAYTELLNANFQKKNYNQLIRFSDKYLKSYPRGILSAKAYFYLGEGFYGKKELDKAVNNYRHALERNGGKDVYLDDLIYQGLSFSMIAKGSLTEAKELIAKINDKELHLFCEGVLYFKTADYAKALEAFDNFLKEFPQSKIITNVYLTKADTLYEMGRINDSLSVYKYILENFKSEQYADVLDKTHYGLAWCYLKKGEFKRGIDEFKNTLKYTNNPIVMVSSQIQIADAYQEASNFSQALDIYNEILKNNPTTIYADYIQFQIGMIFLKTKKLEEALMAFKNLQKNFPSSKLIAQAQYYLAVGYFSADNYQDAQILLEEFMRKFPQSDFLGRAYYLYAKTFFNEKKYDKALEVFKTAIGKLDDKEIEELLYIDMGNCYLNISAYDKAKKVWEDFLAKFPNSSYAASVALYLGGLCEKEENWAEAEKYYKLVLENYSESSVAAEAILSLGHLYLIKQDNEKAEAYFKKVSLSDSPLALKSKLYLAKIYIQKGLSHDALSLYDELINSSSNISKVAKLEKAFLLKDIKQYDQAAVLFKKVVDSGIDSPKIRFTYGTCLEKLEQNKQAIEEYFRAAYMFGSGADNDKEDHSDYKTKAYFRIAKIYDRENNIEAAKQIYKKIIGQESEESKIASERLRELEKQK